MKKKIEDATILVVEDDHRFVNLLTLLLNQMSFHKLHYAVTYEEALRAIEDEEDIDLLLIDIHLGPGRNGIMLAEELRRRHIQTPIIYLTSNHTEEYYAYARHTRPAGFLSKELSRVKVYQAIDIALMPTFDPDKNRDGENAAHPTAQQHSLYFKVGDVFKTIPLNQVAYFYADQKMSIAKVGSRSYPTSTQLKTLEGELPELGFLRIHKSYLINTQLIETINLGESSITINGETLPIGNTYRKEFLAALKMLK
ncbi:response regulator transcription factor [Neolewinella lacunae]|uniref:Response regulator transcription factor n=1 Tax=Neolewinella lacunae TaxID=1517758 RepID=A0A923PJ43_9BACT|nr:response regulator transcription factor [Neolewinella lacunae]MBC6994259.1 response regulator transcription factor [Neolewinella lacunae]MDN3637123.1 response regulator transcription factor [Neolewinella lacunae]